MSRYDAPPPISLLDARHDVTHIPSPGEPRVVGHIRGPSPCSCGGTRAVTADRGRTAVRAACAACTAERISDLEAEVRLMKSLSAIWVLDETSTVSSRAFLNKVGAMLEAAEARLRVISEQLDRIERGNHDNST